MPIVKLFGSLREHSDAPQIHVAGRTVGEVLDILCKDNAALREAIFAVDGLQPHVRVMLAGRDIELAQGLDTPVDLDDPIAIFPPIAGG